MAEFISSTSPKNVKPGKKIRWIDVKEGITGYLFILPALIIIGLFGIFPIGFAAYVSMFQWRINPGNYTGLSNYTKALDNIAYVLGFWLAILLVYLAVRNVKKIYSTSIDHNEHPWVWLVPGTITALGVIALVRFLIILLPKVLDISTQVRGVEKTQALFIKLLGEAWRVPEVAVARNIALVIFFTGVASAVLIGIYAYKSSRNIQYYISLVNTLLYIGVAVLLSWLTWTEIQAAYAAAKESGEVLDIWSQIITISGGFVLLLLSWLAWKSAGRRDSNTSMILRIFAAVVLAIGAWVLIGELPLAGISGDKKWWEGLLVTVYYSIGTVPLQLGVSLLLAVLLF